MEDAHISKPDLTKDISSAFIPVDVSKAGLFAVFDGHGGKEVAKFCQDHFLLELVNTPEFKKKDFVGALKQTFHKMDEMIDNEVI